MSLFTCKADAQAFGLSHAEVRAVVAYAAGGKLLIRVDSDGLGGFPQPSASVMLWDVDPGRQDYSLRDTLPIPGGAVFALAAGADGELRVAIAAGDPGLGKGLGPEPPPGEVKIWDSRTGKVRCLRDRPQGRDYGPGDLARRRPPGDRQRGPDGEAVGPHPLRRGERP